MLVEIFYPPGGTFCLFEPAFNVPYRLVHAVEAPATTLRQVLDWTWRYANIVHRGDPWIKTGLRSAMVGDVFLVNGEAHAVMMMGFERFEFQREGDTLILHGQPGFPSLWSSPFQHTLERCGAGALVLPPYPPASITTIFMFDLPAFPGVLHLLFRTAP